MMKSYLQFSETSFLTASLVVTILAPPFLAFAQGSYGPDGAFLPQRRQSTGVLLNIPYANESSNFNARNNLTSTRQSSDDRHRSRRRTGGGTYFGYTPVYSGDDLTFEGRRQVRERSRPSRNNEPIIIYKGGSKPGSSQTPTIVNNNTTIIIRDGDASVATDEILTSGSASRNTRHTIITNQPDASISFVADQKNPGHIGSFTNIGEDNEIEGVAKLMPEFPDGANATRTQYYESDIRVRTVNDQTQTRSSEEENSSIHQ